MAILTPYLHTSANLYNITTEETESGQPVESLSLVKALKVFFEAYSYQSAIYKLFAPGQIKIGDFLCITDRIVNVNQVLEINDEYYRVVASNQLIVQKVTLGYELSLERYKH